MVFNHGILQPWASSFTILRFILEFYWQLVILWELLHDHYDDGSQIRWKSMPEPRWEGYWPTLNSEFKVMLLNFQAKCSCSHWSLSRNFQASHSWKSSLTSGPTRSILIFIQTKSWLFNCLSVVQASRGSSGPMQSEVTSLELFSVAIGFTGLTSQNLSIILSPKSLMVTCSSFDTASS